MNAVQSSHLTQIHTQTRVQEKRDHTYPCESKHIPETAKRLRANLKIDERVDVRWTK